MVREITKQQHVEVDLKDLICVSAPYLALENIQLLPSGIVQAEVQAENLLSGEATWISAPEAGRHLAILGSCALALQNPQKEKHYYLATHALVERAKDLNGILGKNRSAAPLLLQAAALHLDLAQKKGKCSTKICTPAGQLIFSIEVSYQVLKGTLFQKLFQKHMIPDLHTKLPNPYTANPAITELLYVDDRLSANLGVVQASQCIGHFDKYPALPIAILCAGMARLGGMHLQYKLQQPDLQYAVKYADLSAFRLAFAHEEVRIASQFETEKDGEYTVLVTATDAQGLTLSTIRITYDLLA
jgi:hypothetical protein